MATNRTLQIVIDAKNNAEKELQKLGDQTSTVEKGISKLTVGFLATAGSLGYLGKQMIDAAAQFEQTKVAFTTMLGSAEKANTLLRDLAEFAATTPFQIEDVEKGAKQLLAYGFSAGEITKQLRMLGDVSAGLSVPLEQIVYAYGQVRAAGQLYGTELRQFVNAGVPILAQLAKQFDVTTAEAKKMVEEGKVGFNDVEKAFAGMSGEGGRFFNLMEAQSKTLLGRISNLKDSWNIFLREEGSALIVWAGMLVDNLAKVVDWLRQDAQGFNIVGQMIYGLIKFFEAFGKTVWAVALVFGALIKQMIDAGKVAFALVKDMGDNFGKLGERLGQVFSAIGSALTGNFDDARDKIKNIVSDTFSNTISQLDVYNQANKDSMYGVIQGFKGATMAWEDFASLAGFERAQEKFGELGDGMDNVISKLNDGGKASEKMQNAIEKLQGVMDDFRQKAGDAFDEVTTKITDLNSQLENLFSENAKNQFSLGEDYAQAYVDQEKKVADIQKELEDKKKEYVEKRTEKVTSENLKSHNEAMATLNNEITAIQEKLRIETDALDKAKSVEIVYQNEIAEARRRASLTEFGRLMEDLEKKQIIIEQEFQAQRTKIENELKLEEKKLIGLSQIQDVALKMQEKFLAQQEVASVDSINREIKKYNELADAIARARAGKTSNLVQVGADVNAKANQTIPNINITINGDVSGEELVRKVEYDLMNRIKLSTLIP
jgi:tape measure domain-containing protein